MWSAANGFPSGADIMRTLNAYGWVSIQLMQLSLAGFRLSTTMGGGQRVARGRIAGHNIVTVVRGAGKLNIFTLPQSDRVLLVK